MAKKREKDEVRQKLKEDALKASVSDKPNTGNSKKSFEVLKAKKIEQAEKVRREAEERKKLAASSAQGNWGKVKKNVAGAGAGAATKPKAVERTKEQQKKIDEEKKMQVQVEAVAEAEAEVEAEAVEQIVFSPTTAMAKRRNSCSDAPSNHNNSNNEESFKHSSSNPSLLATIETAAVSIESNGNFVEGTFFTRFDSESKKGHRKIRDGCLFQMTTMFRKRDKMSGKGSAVALLVGRTEEAPHEEKCIDVIFDNTKMTEEEAWGWYRENETR